MEASEMFLFTGMSKGHVTGHMIGHVITVMCVGGPVGCGDSFSSPCEAQTNEHGSMCVHALCTCPYEHVFHLYFSFVFHDCVFTDEPFMLQFEIHCMSLWQLKIVDSN